MTKKYCATCGTDITNRAGKTIYCMRSCYLSAKNPNYRPTKRKRADIVPLYEISLSMPQDEIDWVNQHFEESMYVSRSAMLRDIINNYRKSILAKA